MKVKTQSQTLPFPLEEGRANETSFEYIIENLCIWKLKSLFEKPLAQRPMLWSLYQ